MIYYEFLKHKTNSGINKRFSEKEKHIGNVAAPESATCPADVSTGPPNADVFMASDDISVDLVNVDQVNRSTGSTSM